MDQVLAAVPAIMAMYSPLHPCFDKLAPIAQLHACGNALKHPHPGITMISCKLTHFLPRNLASAGSEHYKSGELWLTSTSKAAESKSSLRSSSIISSKEKSKKMQSVINFMALLSLFKLGLIHAMPVGSGYGKYYKACK